MIENVVEESTDMLELLQKLGNIEILLDKIEKLLAYIVCILAFFVICYVCKLVYKSLNSIFR